MPNVFDRAAQIQRDLGFRKAPPVPWGMHAGTCIMGAVALAQGYHPDEWMRAVSWFGVETPENELLSKLVKEQYPEYTPSFNAADKTHSWVWRWNDEVGTLEASVALLEKAAVITDELAA